MNQPSDQDSDLLQETRRKLEHARAGELQDRPKRLKFRPLPEVDAETVRKREEAALLRAKLNTAHETDQWNSAVFKKVGKRYENCTLDNFQADLAGQRGVLDSVREYAADLPSNISEGRNVMFLGPPGTGKDHLMVALIRCASERRVLCEWVDGADLFSEMRDRMGSDGDEWRFIERFTKPHVFAISDPLPPIGAVTDFQRILLFRVIDRRYRDMRPTWMTLNVEDRAEAERRLSVNICDRLGEGALIAECKWPSYRRAIGQLAQKGERGDAN